MILIPEELFSRTFAGANSQGLKLQKVYRFYQMFQLLPGLEFCENPIHTIKCELLYFDAVLYDECTIYLDYHKWVLQNFDASFYGGGIAPFIWTIINGCFKILMLCSMVEESHHLFGLS